MEIEQFLYDMTESGDAIIAYKMYSDSGSVELCNMGASILSYVVEGCEIASGSCRRSMTTSNGSAKGLDQRLWESRVEENRVVMSTEEIDGESLTKIEVIFDFDDDNILEITYQAFSNNDIEIDLTHQLTLNNDVSIISIGEQSADDATKSVLANGSTIYRLANAELNILKQLAKLKSGDTEIIIESSHPALITSANNTLATSTSSPRYLNAGERFVQKTRFIV